MSENRQGQCEEYSNYRLLVSCLSRRTLEELKDIQRVYGGGLV